MIDQPKITDHIPEAIRQTVIYICQLAAIRFGSSVYRILARTRSERASPVYSRGDNDARVLAMALVAAAFPQRDIAELSGLFRRSRQSMVNAIGVGSSPRFRSPWGHCAKALQARGIAVPAAPPGWNRSERDSGTAGQRNKSEFVPICPVPPKTEQRNSTELFGTVPMGGKAAAAVQNGTHPFRGVPLFRPSRASSVSEAELF